MLVDRGENVSFGANAAWAIIDFFIEITYMGTLNKFANQSEWIESESRRMFYKIDLNVLICHYCEKLIIFFAALVLKDALHHNRQNCII